MMNEFHYVYCRQCSDNFPMRQTTYDELEKCGNTFYCPQGHALVISRESIVTQLRHVKQESERKSDTISRLENSANALRGVQTRQRKRLLRGVCPYCNITPKDIIKHIRDRHHPKGVIRDK